MNLLTGVSLWPAVPSSAKLHFEIVLLLTISLELKKRETRFILPPLHGNILYIFVAVQTVNSCVWPILPVCSTVTLSC